MTAWTKENKKKPIGSKCGAKNRTNGQPCENFAMPNGRCRLHGGKTIPAPKGHTRSLKHGLYASGLLKSERSIYPHIQLGTIDDELRMLKIQLRRAHFGQRLWLEERAKISRALEKGKKIKRSRLVMSEQEKIARAQYLVESVEVTRQSLNIGMELPAERVTKKVMKRKEDFSGEIKRLTRLIAALELRRKELLEQSKDAVKELVGQFREYADEAIGTLPGGSG